MSDYRIVVLERGWIFVGDYKQKKGFHSITNAKNIRVWGTTKKGLGYLAKNGPTENTVLDEVTGEIRTQNVIFTIQCLKKAWV